MKLGSKENQKKKDSSSAKAINSVPSPEKSYDKYTNKAKNFQIKKNVHEYKEKAQLNKNSSITFFISDKKVDTISKKECESSSTSCKNCNASNIKNCKTSNIKDLSLNSNIRTFGKINNFVADRNICLSTIQSIDQSKSDLVIDNQNICSSLRSMISLLSMPDQEQQKSENIDFTMLNDSIDTDYSNKCGMFCKNHNKIDDKNTDKNKFIKDMLLLEHILKYIVKKNSKPDTQFKISLQNDQKIIIKQAYKSIKIYRDSNQTDDNMKTIISSIRKIYKSQKKTDKSSDISKITLDLLQNLRNFIRDLSDKKQNTDVPFKAKIFTARIKSNQFNPENEANNLKHNHVAETPKFKNIETPKFVKLKELCNFDKKNYIYKSDPQVQDTKRYMFMSERIRKTQTIDNILYIPIEKMLEKTDKNFLIKTSGRIFRKDLLEKIETESTLIPRKISKV